MDAQDAIQELHFPKSLEEVRIAQKRIAFEEMFLIQLAAIRARISWEESKAVPVKFDEKLIKKFVAFSAFQTD